MILKGDNQEIELEIKGYQFPKITNNEWDNNWLVLYCRKTFNGHTIRGTFPCFVTTELIRLHNMLRQFANRESDFLEWGGTEPNFYISIQRTREHCVLEIFFYPENGTEDYEDVKLFRKNATDEDIQSLIEFCTVNISRYPVRKREEIKGAAYGDL